MTPFLVVVALLHPALSVLSALALCAICFGTLFIPTGAFTQDAVNKLLAGDFLTIASSGAIDPHKAARYLITKAGVAALTLAAPASPSEDGLQIEVVSTTANAHTITATGLFRDGTANVNLATFAAQIGASIILQAIQGKWYVVTTRNVAIS